MTSAPHKLFFSSVTGILAPGESRALIVSLTACPTATSTLKRFPTTRPNGAQLASISDKILILGQLAPGAQTSSSQEGANWAQLDIDWSADNPGLFKAKATVRYMDENASLEPFLESMKPTPSPFEGGKQVSNKTAPKSGFLRTSGGTIDINAANKSLLSQRSKRSGRPGTVTRDQLGELGALTLDSFNSTGTVDGATSEGSADTLDSVASATLSDVLARRRGSVITTGTIAGQPVQYGTGISMMANGARVHTLVASSEDETGTSCTDSEMEGSDDGEFMSGTMVIRDDESMASGDVNLAAIRAAFAGDSPNQTMESKVTVASKDSKDSKGKKKRRSRRSKTASTSSFNGDTFHFYEPPKRPDDLVSTPGSVGTQDSPTHSVSPGPVVASGAVPVLGVTRVRRDSVVSGLPPPLPIKSAVPPTSMAQIGRSVSTASSNFPTLPRGGGRVRNSTLGSAMSGTTQAYPPGPSSETETSVVKGKSSLGGFLKWGVVQSGVILASLAAGAWLQHRFDVGALASHYWMA